MAQRKSPPPSTKKAAAAKPSASKPSTGRGASNRPNPTKPAAKPVASKPAKRKPSTSIVNQRQTPWGLIAVAVVIVLFAGGIVAFAVTRGGGKSSNSAKNVKPATATVQEIEKIPGIAHKDFASRNHQAGLINYSPDSPPFGGPHNQYWAQCTGVVYDHQLANENAVHPLEHGAIWITYRPGLDQASIDKLSQKVLGVNYMFMTPYAGLKTPISLQAWGYQLFVNSADDPRIDQFISDLRLNQNTTPEYGASCDDPNFKASQSTPGHPFNG